jgi:hypothetical protein
MIDKEEYKLSSRDFLQRLEDEQKARAAKPFLIRTFLDLIDFIWYGIILRIKEIPSQIKWKYQEVVYGYSDPDVWNLNSFIIKKTYAPLKDFVKNYEEHGMSLPTEFATDPGTWLMILKKIEFAFDSSWDDEFEIENRFTKGMNNEQVKEHYLKVEEGLTLFGRYIHDLWD